MSRVESRNEASRRFKTSGRLTESWEVRRTLTHLDVWGSFPIRPDVLSLRRNVVLVLGQRAGIPFCSPRKGWGEE